MKSLVILGVCLTLTSARGSEGKKPRVDGHGDGEIHLSVAFRVLDARSDEPLSDVRVTFYDKIEVAILRSIDVAKQKGRISRDEVPSGAIARTSHDGSTTIKCRFDAAFLWSFESGDRKDVGTDVYPSGRFVLSKPGYLTLDRTAREVFTSPPYSPEQLEMITTLRLERKPNQSSEPTPTSVTTPAVQEIAPAAVVAHL